MPQFSKYNIFSKVKDSDNHFIVNILSGNADILDAETAAKIRLIKEGKTVSDADLTNSLIEKGYYIDENAEKKLYNSKYLEFLDDRDDDEIQLFFVTNYSCNFACSYCYQDEYSNPNLELTIETIDAFYQYVKLTFANRKKYITVFGGEPLLPSEKQKKLIGYFLEKAKNEKLEVSIVTNGYSLAEYADILKNAPIREIQITLDGTAEIHDKRRFLKGGGATFEKISEGVDLCIANKITVNLRSVVDKGNITNLQELAKYAIDKDWTSGNYFKTQIGRNYELHHCQHANENLFSRISLYESIYEETKKHPHIIEYYKPAYSIAKFLFENEELPSPLFDSCPACKTEWAFDYTGSIYSCTATVGKTDEKLGAFYPTAMLNNEAVEKWEERDVTTIEKCKTCNLQLACGGGCGSVAKNQNGSICSTDCRPITELLELGFAQYFEYGFNGKEHENEASQGDYDFGARIYDSKIGRWLSVDPMQSKYPNWTPYHFALNSPLRFTDKDGEVVYDSKGNAIMVGKDGEITAYNEKGEAVKPELDASTQKIFSALIKTPRGIKAAIFFTTDKSIYKFKLQKTKVDGTHAKTSEKNGIVDVVISTAKLGKNDIGQNERFETAGDDERINAITVHEASEWEKGRGLVDDVTACQNELESRFEFQKLHPEESAPVNDYLPNYENFFKANTGNIEKIKSAKDASDNSVNQYYDSLKTSIKFESKIEHGPESIQD